MKCRVCVSCESTALRVKPPPIATLRAGRSPIKIKDDAELQHVLAHVLRAIQFLTMGVEALAEGDGQQAKTYTQTASYELGSIEGLVAFDGDEDFVRHIGNKRLSKE